VEPNGQQTPAAESNSPGNNLGDGFNEILKEAEASKKGPASVPEKKPARGRPKKKGKTARRVPRAAKAAVSESLEVTETDPQPAPIDFDFLRTLARIPFTLAGIVTGRKQLSLTDPETDLVAVALAPVAEKYLPGTVAAIGPELNLAAVSGMLVVEKLGLLEPSPEEPEAVAAPEPMKEQKTEQITESGPAHPRGPLSFAAGIR